MLALPVALYLVVAHGSEGLHVLFEKAREYTAFITLLGALFVITGGIYVRDGSTFFDVVYLNGTVPTDDQLKYYATLILGELP